MSALFQIYTFAEMSALSLELQPNMTRTFPDQFLWGSATAAYQVEGAVNTDGRGLSIWDQFCRTPGKIEDGSSGDLACDHYHRYRDDISLMAGLGMRAYRFSVCWARILPNGVGKVNGAGLDFYDRLVDTLLQHRIQPFVTLYHWDMPQALQDKGGWANRDLVSAYADYAAVVAARLGDRVKNWITLNEPWVSAFMGYFMGVHAPGLTDWRTGLQVSHHLNLAHGRGSQAIRAASADAKVGIALNLSWTDPASDSEADRAAAWRHDGYVNRWFLDPLFKGSYPVDMIEWLGPDAPTIAPGDLSIIQQPNDFLGINYYTRSIIGEGDDFPQMKLRWVYGPNDHTDMGWEVYPDGLYHTLMRVTQDYQPTAIYITENGAAFPDKLNGTEEVHDEKRVNYLRAHFESAQRAIEDGAPLKGYFVWSLMDNFEWSYGYTKRFGLVYVDYPTQKRVLKTSARFYQNVIRHNAV